VEEISTVKILIKAGRVIDPSQDLDDNLDVLVSGGSIADVGPSIDGDGAEVIDAKGLVVCPGLVDMHVHLREPGREDEETIESGARAAIAGGFTSIACMPNTSPPIEGEEGVRFVLSKAADAGFARVYPVAAISKGLEGQTLSEIGSAISAGAVGVSDDGMPVRSSAVMRRALEYVRMFDRPVMSHCEDLDLSGGGAMNEGKVSAVLGLKGMPGASEDVSVIRDMTLADLTDSRLHVCHVSTARSLEFIREAKRGGIRVTCEATPHHLVLTDEATREFDTNTKMNPPLRDEKDMVALRHGIKAGIIDAIASDHAPHSAEEKDQEFNRAPFGIVGLETSLGLACTCLYHDNVISLPDLVRCMSTNPAQILGTGLGTLQKGAPADITLFDPEREWAVDEARFESKSANTPFSGWNLKGAAVSVLVRGRVLMRDRELTSELREGDAER
jgi:dihydroorotase